MLAPKAVICLRSALNLHRISAQVPNEVWVALPSGTHAPSLEGPALQVIRLSKRAYTEGIMTILVDGVPVRTYNVAKTVTDCFKLRSKVGLEVALAALRDSWNARQWTVPELHHYAQVNRMSNVMRPYVQALVAQGLSGQHAYRRTTAYGAAR
jgi:predicted transcriptional regulator of viral defense system